MWPKHWLFRSLDGTCYRPPAQTKHFSSDGIFGLVLRFFVLKLDDFGLEVRAFCLLTSGVTIYKFLWPALYCFEIFFGRLLCVYQDWSAGIDGNDGQWNYLFLI